MDEQLTVADLEKRWQKALEKTLAAVQQQPAVYRELKALAGHIVSEPLDIQAYLPTAKKIVQLLEQLDPCGRDSIFYYFNARIAPSSIWDAGWLRMECNDLIAHLKAFDVWRIDSCRLRLVRNSTDRD